MTKQNLLVISDIHGMIKQFKMLLERAFYNPQTDQLILLGDYIDRGPDSRLVIEEVIRLVEEDGAIALKGNHDHYLIQHILYKDPNIYDLWMQKGGDATIYAYKGYENDLYRHAEWLDKNLKLYYETEEFIFVHAGVIPDIPMQEQKEQDLLWTRHQSKCGLGKTIVHGHTPVLDVTRIHDQLFIDTGAVFGYKLSIVKLHMGGTYETFEVCSEGIEKTKIIRPL